MTEQRQGIKENILLFASTIKDDIDKICLTDDSVELDEMVWYAKQDLVVLQSMIQENKFKEMRS